MAILYGAHGKFTLFHVIIVVPIYTHVDGIPQSVITSRYSNFGMLDVYDPISGLDFVFVGLWAGLLFGITGLIGMCASYDKNVHRYTWLTL